MPSGSTMSTVWAQQEATQVALPRVPTSTINLLLLLSVRGNSEAYSVLLHSAYCSEQSGGHNTNLEKDANTMVFERSSARKCVHMHDPSDLGKNQPSSALDKAARADMLAYRGLRLAKRGVCVTCGLPAEAMKPISASANRKKTRNVKIGRTSTNRANITIQRFDQKPTILQCAFAHHVDG